MPAIITQLRKNMATFLAHSASVMNRDHISPATRKPLYKPWLAANALVGSNRCSGKERNVFLPAVVQANISIPKIYRCSIDTSNTKILAIRDMDKGDL